MASTREIKRRIKGITSIKQITKAMELVSTAKLRKAKLVLEKSRPYYETVLSNINEVMKHLEGEHPLLKVREVKNSLYIVLTSDRGLAGGYNSNILKMVQEDIGDRIDNSKLIVVGNKAREFFTRRGYDIVKSCVGIGEEPSYGDAKNLARLALDLYQKGEIDEIKIAYTRFESTLKYIPRIMTLLPSKEMKETEKSNALIEFEPSAGAVLNYLIPKYIESSIYGSLIEAAASEQGARRMSMEAATDNAVEMIDDLQTNYNRARQAAITNEITEIVSGANALK